MTNPVFANAQATLLSEVRTNYIDAMEHAAPRFNAIIDKVVDKVGMESRLEKYAYWELTGNPRRWEDNNAIPEVVAKQKMYLLQLHNWGAKMKWSLWDARDSKNASLASEAKKLARKHMLLRPRIFAQILESSTDDDLKDTIETASDGVALYSSSTRFSHASGNIVSITDVTNALLAYEAIWKFHTRFSQFLGPDGKNPLLDEDEYSHLIIFVHPTKNQFWQEAAKQALRPEVVIASVAGANVDSLINVPDGIKVDIISFPYLAGTDDVYCFAANGDYKAILEGTKQGLEEYEYGPHNSEEAGRYAYEAYQCFERFNLRPHWAQYTLKGDVS